MHTHYAYITDASGRDVVTKTFNLWGVKSRRRGEMIGQLMNDGGECLARLPPNYFMNDEVDVQELTKFINGET